MDCSAAGDDVLVSDLGELVGAGDLSESDPNAWRALPYEAEGFSPRRRK